MEQELVSDRKGNVNVTISSRTSDVLKIVLVEICRVRQEQMFNVYFDIYITFHITDTIMLFYCRKLFNLNLLLISKYAIKTIANAMRL